jgi:hypothetical protein
VYVRVHVRVRLGAHAHADLESEHQVRELQVGRCLHERAQERRVPERRLPSADREARPAEVPNDQHGRKRDLRERERHQPQIGVDDEHVRQNAADEVCQALDAQAHTEAHLADGEDVERLCEHL